MSWSATRRSRRLAVSVLVVAAAATEASAIEMFTYFGDGSRIGLPSLEVPIEAYPGIPLRSDRLRARRRALRSGAGTAAVAPQPGQARGITIRTMPTGTPVQPAVPRKAAEPRSATPPSPVAPEPPVEAIPPGAPTAE